MVSFTPEYPFYETTCTGDSYRAKSFSDFVRFEASYLITGSIVPSWIKR